jgi:hypothetical protein
MSIEESVVRLQAILVELKEIQSGDAYLDHVLDNEGDVLLDAASHIDYTIAALTNTYGV